MPHNIMSEEMTDERKILYPKKKVSLPVWEIFGFRKKDRVLDTAVSRRCWSTVSYFMNYSSYYKFDISTTINSLSFTENLLFLSGM